MPEREDLTYSKQNIWCVPNHFDYFLLFLRAVPSNVTLFFTVKQDWEIRGIFVLSPDSHTKSIAHPSDLISYVSPRVSSGLHYLLFLREQLQESPNWFSCPQRSIHFAPAHRQGHFLMQWFSNCAQRSRKVSQSCCRGFSRNERPGLKSGGASEHPHCNSTSSN